MHLLALRSLLTVACRGACARDAEDDSEEEGSGEEGVLAQFVSGEEDIPLIDETYRLAVVDLEWERMRAVDIFAVWRPCVAKPATSSDSRGTRRARCCAHSCPQEARSCASLCTLPILGSHG